MHRRCNFKSFALIAILVLAESSFAQQRSEDIIYNRIAKEKNSNSYLFPLTKFQMQQDGGLAHEFELFRYPHLVCVDLEIAKSNSIISKFSKKSQRQIRKLGKESESLFRESIKAPRNNFWQEFESIDDRFQRLLPRGIRNEVTCVRNLAIANQIGFARTFAIICNNVKDPLTEKEFRAIRKAEKQVASRLNAICAEFKSKTKNEILSVLTETQIKELESVLRLYRDNRFPEILVTQSKDESEIESQENFVSPWNSVVTWNFIPGSGFVCLEREVNPAYGITRLINIILNTPLGKSAEVVEEQNHQLREYLDELAEIGQDVGERLNQGEISQSDAITELEKVSERYVGKFKRVLLPQQLAWIEDENIKFEVARHGLYASLMRGSLVERIDITKKQKKQIKLLVNKRSETFNTKVARQLPKELTSITGQLEKHRAFLFKENFRSDEKLRTVQIGLLAFALAM